MECQKSTFFIFRFYHDSYYCSSEDGEVIDNFVKPDALLVECDCMTIIISNVANSESAWPPSVLKWIIKSNYY